MITVHRYQEGSRSIPLFDVHDWNPAGVARAWHTMGTLGNPIFQEVTTQRAWVHLTYEGTPPDDAEVVRLSGIDPACEGTILLPYFEEYAGGVVTILRWGFADPPQKARWGMLVIQHNPGSPS